MCAFLSESAFHEVMPHPNFQEEDGEPPHVNGWVSGKFCYLFMHRVYDHLQHVRTRKSGAGDKPAVTSLMLLFTSERGDGGPDGPERIAGALIEDCFPTLLVIPIPICDIPYGNPHLRRASIRGSHPNPSSLRRNQQRS